MEAVIKQVRDFTSSADEAGRSRILDQLRELSYSLESPDETMNRIMFLVRFSIAFVQTSTSLSNKMNVILIFES